jgi:hypothetical protein
VSRATFNNRTLARMRALNPASASGVAAGIDPEELQRAMRRAIALGGLPKQPVPAGDDVAKAFAQPPRPAAALFGRRRRVVAVAGLAVVVALAAAIVLSGGFSAGRHPDYAEAAVKVAEANPRLLVGEPGWGVVDAGEFEADEGETTFSDGAHQLALNWYPARYYRSYLDDRGQVSTPQRSELLGSTATTVDYGRNEFATMLSPQGDVFVEVRGRFASRAEYDQAVGSLHRVDVDTWLAAMPPSVVGPDQRAGVVAGMLREVPLPPGFDLAGLQGEAAVLNHYALAVKVADTVSCAWVERWIEAKRGGDPRGAQEAVDAMSGAAGWPLLSRMEAEEPGGWAINIRASGRELAAGHLNRDAAGSMVNPDGSGYELGPVWAVKLNCTSHYWRRPLQK